MDKHLPRAATMEAWLGALRDFHGGAAQWLRANGWTENDATALRRRLLD